MNKSKTDVHFSFINDKSLDYFNYLSLCSFAFHNYFNITVLPLCVPHDLESAAKALLKDRYYKFSAFKIDFFCIASFIFLFSEK